MDDHLFSERVTGEKVGGCKLTFDPQPSNLQYRHRRRSELWLLLGILLLAFGLRVFRLAGQSLWYDEGTSVALAGRSLSTITHSAAADIHPPFYYYVLHVWTRATGFSPTAVRALSAFLGTWLVAMTWRLGRDLCGARVGLAAAFLAAISPFQVYYAQETRMYMLVTALGAWVIWLGYRWWAALVRNPTTWPALRQNRRLMVAYGVAAVLVLYTHYLGFALLLALNLAVGVWILAQLRERLRWLLPWGTLHLAVAVLYLPWLFLTWTQLQQWPAVSAPFSLGFLLREALRVFSLGRSVPDNIFWPLLPFGILLTAGVMTALIQVLRRRASPRTDPFAFLVLLFYLATPVITLYVLALRRPFYHPKFLLLATPAFYLVVALGLQTVVTDLQQVTQHGTRGGRRQTAYQGNPLAPLRRWITPLATGLLVAVLAIPSLDSLYHYYFDPRYARDDYRGIARLIEGVGRPGDAILLNAPSQIEIFDYYYGGDLPAYPLPRERPPDPENLRSELQRILQKHSRIFGIFWATNESDPQGIVENWLNEHAYKALDAWYGHVRLVLYKAPPASDAGTAYPIHARLGDHITLESVTLVERRVAAGDVLPLTLRWHTQAPLETRYKVFVQLLSPTWQIIAQRDAEPGGGQRLTISWQPQEGIEDRYGLWIPPGTPPADYRLIIGMYRPDTGERLPVIRDGAPAGDFVDLGTIRVEAPAIPPPIEALNLAHRVEKDYGPVRLLGYNLDKRGAEGQTDVPLFPGDTLRIILFWQARQTLSHDLALTFSVLSGRSPLTRFTFTPTDGLYPAPQWSANEIVRDAHDIGLPADLTPGRYRLQLVVADPAGRPLGPPLEIPFRLQSRP